MTSKDLCVGQPCDKVLASIKQLNDLKILVFNLVFILRWRYLQIKAEPQLYRPLMKVFTIRTEVMNVQLQVRRPLNEAGQVPGQPRGYMFRSLYVLVGVLVIPTELWKMTART
jgi:hypothetical protein